MKNKNTKMILVTSCLCLLLTSCVTFSKDNLSSGLQRNSNFESSEDENIDVKYFDGDSINLDNFLSYGDLYFNSSYNEGSYISNEQDFLSIVNKNKTTISYELISFSYVSQGYVGLKLGVNTIKEFGKLKIKFDESFNAIKIYALPRNVSTLDYLTGQNIDQIDKNVAIKANDKDFILLNKKNIEKISELVEDECCYTFSESTNELTLYSTGGRALISRIEFFKRK